MTMAEPTGVSVVIISAMPVMTSGIAKIRAGSGDQPSRSAVKAVKTSPSRPMWA
jgi:hypothetical protein